MAALAAINAYLSEQPPVARQSIKVTLGTRRGDTPGVYDTSAGQSGTGVDCAAAVAAAAAGVAIGTGDASVENLATQAAVAALNVAIGGDVQITWDTTKITTVSQLRVAFNEALRAAAGGGILTP